MFKAGGVIAIALAVAWNYPNVVLAVVFVAYSVLLVVLSKCVVNIWMLDGGWYHHHHSEIRKGVEWGL